MVGDRRKSVGNYNNDYLAERSARAPSLERVTNARIGRSNQITDIIGACLMQAGLSMVVWILKREVRAIGGCLGIHRR